MRIKISTIRKIQFLLAIIVFVFMTINFLTDIYVFIQIAATVALVNFAISCITLQEERHIDEILSKGDEK